MKAAFPAVALVGSATLLALVASGGSPLAAAVPVAVAALAWAVWRAPLRVCVLGTMFLCLVADVPQDNPMNGVWHSPLYGLGLVLCTNWSKAFGVRGLAFSGLDLVCLALAARILARGHVRGRDAGVLWTALGGFAAAILGLLALGAARSGDMDAAYWQVRQLAFIPVFAWFLSHALDRESDPALLARLVVAAALIKAAVGLYFHFAIVRPQGLSVPVITSHAETMLFCLALALLVIRWLEQPDAAALRRGLWMGTLVLAAIWLNDRRIAYVGLAGSFVIVWQMSRWNRAKRAAARIALLGIPFLIAYFVAGWRSDAALFKPVVAIRTMVVANDEAPSADVSSTQWRRIENYNLSQTARIHPFGTGLGQMYEEVRKAPDISSDFKLYRYIPHNSVLWMVSAGGPIGFVLLWAPFVVGMFLAARSHRHARTPLQRMSALASMCALLLFLVQAYGDMGTQTWSTTWLVSAALAVTGRLASATGAWPARPHLEMAWSA